MSPGVLVTSAISKFNLTSSASVHIQNYFIWRWSCGSFGDVVTHWECTRLLGQRSWVRIRHIPQKSWCTAGSLFNNVENLRGERRKPTPEAKKEKHFFLCRLPSYCIVNNVYCQGCDDCVRRNRFPFRADNQQQRGRLQSGVRQLSQVISDYL